MGRGGGQAGHGDVWDHIEQAHTEPAVPAVSPAAGAACPPPGVLVSSPARPPPLRRTFHTLADPYLRRHSS